MKKLEKKVAIITGASKGIGAATARAFAAEGAAVIVNYSSDKAAADKVVDEIRHHGGLAHAVKGNVAVTADVQHLFKETLRMFSRVDILVNNAGVYSFGPLEAVTEEDFHRQFNTYDCSGCYGDSRTRCTGVARGIWRADDRRDAVRSAWEAGRYCQRCGVSGL